jgi:hypothetical protein
VLTLKEALKGIVLAPPNRQGCTARLGQLTTSLDTDPYQHVIPLVSTAVICTATVRADQVLGLLEP